MRIEAAIQLHSLLVPVDGIRWMSWLGLSQFKQRGLFITEASS